MAASHAAASASALACATPLPPAPPPAPVPTSQPKTIVFEPVALATGHNWHVARAWRALATTPLLLHADPFMALVIADVRKVLRGWCTHCGDARWSSFLNRKSFLHEVEEAITPLVALCRRIARETARDDIALADITVVDLACGKAFFSMILGGLRGLRPQLRARVARIVLVEKASVDYAHVALAAVDVQATAEAAGGRADAAACVLEVWPRTNVFDDALLLRISALEAPHLWLVGIHLCRRLSSRCVELANVLDASFLALAPCCLPRWRGACSQPIVVAQSARTLAQMRERVSRAASAIAERDATWRSRCWKCGEEGHSKSACVASAATISALRARAKRRERGLLDSDDDAPTASLDPQTLGREDSQISSGRSPPIRPSATGLAPHGQAPAGGGEEATRSRPKSRPFAAWMAFLSSALRKRPGSTKYILEAHLGSSSGGGGGCAHHDGDGAIGGLDLRPGGSTSTMSTRKVSWLVLC